MKDRIKLTIGESIDVKLLFDEPIKGTNDYGDYTMYTFDVDGKEMIFNASELAHGQLSYYKKGDVVNIHRRDIGNGKSKYVIEPKSSASNQSSGSSKPDWDSIAEGKVRHGFALEAYKQGKPLDNATIARIQEWVDYVMNGSQQPQIKKDDDLPF